MQWLSRIPLARAGARCDCGLCPSIALEDDHGRVPESSTTRVILSTVTADLLFVLFIEEDRLAYLELVSLSDGPVDNFPTPDHCRSNT